MKRRNEAAKIEMGARMCIHSYGGQSKECPGKVWLHGDTWTRGI